MLNSPHTIGIGDLDPTSVPRLDGLFGWALERTTGEKLHRQAGLPQTGLARRTDLSSRNYSAISAVNRTRE